MLLTPTLSDHFGRQFRLLTSRQRRPHSALRAETFFSTEQALRFLHQLTAPHGYWVRVHGELSTVFQLVRDERGALESLSQMLYRGTLQAYRVDTVNTPASSGMAFRDEDKTQYALKPVNYLLLNTPPELKKFANEREALAFLDKSGISQEQLDGLLKEQDITRSKDTKESAARALVAGSLIVTVSRYSSPPPPTSSDSAAGVTTDKPVDLGPPPDEFKEITLDLIDEFDNSLGGAFTTLFDGIEYTLKTDTGEEHKGVIQNGKINIPKAKMGSGFEITFKDLPAFMDE